MSIRSAIRSQSYTLLRETSGDSNFTDTQINDFIDQAISLIAPIIEHPRKESSGTQVSEGNGDVTLPTDNLVILNAYFGDKAVLSDWTPIKVVTEEVLKAIAPNWGQTPTSSEGRPAYFLVKSRTTGHLYPHASAAESVSGKKWWVNYVYQPAVLSNDSNSPDLPLPYHDILKFYVCHLCYLNLSNPAMADYMFKLFSQNHQAIRGISTREAQETMRFSWGISEN